MKKLFVAVLIAVSVLGCQKNETTTSQSEAAPHASAAAPSGDDQAENTYTMTGTLVSRNAAMNEVTIENDEVPGGVMARMVMPYELRGGNANDLPADGRSLPPPSMSRTASTG